MNWKSNILAFFAVVGAICVIPFVTIDESGEVKKPETTQVSESERPPIVLQDGTNITNIVERAVNQGVDWFKDSSNYIWDGWKIK